jgi:nitroreductase
MQVFDAINKRHSYRGEFVDKPISRKDLTRIVQAGIQAPSGYNGQSTSFVIVDDKSLLEKITEIVPNEVIKGAPAVIVCLMDLRATSDKDYFFGVEDYGAAVENIFLAVTDLGYATVWIDGALRREDRSERIRRLLGAPEGRQVRVILPLGIPAEQRKQKEKKEFGQRAWFNRYGGE